MAKHLGYIQVLFTNKETLNRQTPNTENRQDLGQIKTNLFGTFPHALSFKKGQKNIW